MAVQIVYELGGELQWGLARTGMGRSFLCYSAAKEWLIAVGLCRIIRQFDEVQSFAEERVMKRFTRLALAGLLTAMGCGSDDIVKPTPDHATPWVGEFVGTGNFALSNGTSGVERPIAVTIVQVDPKHITVAATLTYGEGRNDFTREIAILEPDDPDQITLEARFISTKTVYSFIKVDDTITGSIVASTLRAGGTWTQDKSLTSIEVVRQ